MTKGTLITKGVITGSVITDTLIVRGAFNVLSVLVRS